MEIKLSNRSIGDSHPVFIIAEGGDNHMGSLDDAKEMARLALLAGADAIKYQHHLPDEEMLKDIPISDNMNEPLYDFLKKNALSLNQHIALKSYCDEIGIRYMCTPFSYKAAQELVENDLVDIIKIGSGEMTDIPSMLKISDLGLPMILSTGMCNIEEIQETYDALVSNGTTFAFTNCVSEYPPVYEDINLHVITKMIDLFPNSVIGHSDHTPTLYTAYGAVMLGAKIIEKHVILNKLTPGPDQSVSLDFNEFRELVSGIRILEAASGSIKKIHEKEEIIRSWAFRSIVSIVDICEGETITQDMIWSKRPGTGIPAKKMDEVLGKKALKNIPKDTIISWDDIN